MTEKNLALDFSVKSLNLARFLSEEKGERLITPLFVKSVTTLGGAVYSFKNAYLTKQDAAQYKKEASLECEKIAFYLDMLYSSGFISLAQHGSVEKSLENLRKELNL